ncbi:glutathione transferase GstA [Oxalobacter vibrioformis]|uniref:Glutathione transferase GstA n=1 Tax=Oxalobacter vibrioformis TaxID=933080 RepID=A0A9E9M178_9BURK|nr:glutathione transferase GstA [Oxalobacter vibrioformis]WAW10953.1 glutathione transferase GstA [Oxalobacter vibrioformis]
MKLYYTPGASSLATHIALREAGLAFDMEKVDLREKKTESGKDFYQVSAKGAVPVLQLDNGQVLTEGAAVLQYVADQAPGRKLAPEPGNMQRYRLMEWLNLIATELHKNYTPFFNPAMPDPCKEIFRGNLNRYYDVVESQLSQTAFLLGDTFSVADAYLFTVTRYADFVGLDLAKWPSLQAFQARVNLRPAVLEALKAERL